MPDELKPCPFPWNQRGDELTETAGRFADLAAWDEWAANNWIDGVEDYQERDDTDDVAIYHLCCRAFADAWNRREGKDA